MAGLEGMVGVIDIMNVYGFILIGLALFTGLFVLGKQVIQDAKKRRFL